MMKFQRNWQNVDTVGNPWATTMSQLTILDYAIG